MRNAQRSHESLGNHHARTHSRHGRHADAAGTSHRQGGRGHLAIATHRKPFAFGYVRVSRLDQLDDATLQKLGRPTKAGGGRFSYPQQKADVEAFYQNTLQPKGFDWGGIVEDPGESAFKKRLRHRPGGEILCNALMAGDVVISAVFDRMFRNHLDCMNQYSEWRLRDIQWYSLDLPMAFGTGDPLVSDMIVMFYSACAEMESRRKRERRLSSHRAGKAAGAKCGPDNPWGMMWAGNPRRPDKQYLVPDYGEIAILLELKRCRQLGASYTQLEMAMSRCVALFEGVKAPAPARHHGRV